MSDQLLAIELAAVLSGDEDFAEPYKLIHASLQGDVADRPLLTLHGEYKSYGRRRIGKLDLQIRTRVASEGAISHSDLSTALLEKLILGENAKDTIKAAVLDRGNVELTEYGIGPDGLRSGAEEEDIVTVLSLSAAWREI